MRTKLESTRPTNLHLSHSWGGGLGLWMEEFARADEHSENLALESCGTLECYGIGLRLTSLASGEPLDSWVLRHPISEMRRSHTEYAAILETICSDYRVDHIYVSSLIGHSLDVFRLGLPVTQIHHDYFSFCPALFISRDGICTSCTADDLRSCQLSNPHYPPKNSPPYYAQLRDAFFDAVTAADVRHVCPSRSLPENLGQLDSRFGDRDFTVIKHGIAHRKRDCFGGAEDGRRLRVGLLGYLSWNKGLELMRRLFDTLRVIADIHFVGAHDAGSEFAGRWGSHYLHHYSQDDLPAIFERRRLDLALFLANVPESFSYTLSEARCFCVPPAVRPIGALGERTEHGTDGFVLGLDDDALVDFLLFADRRRDELRQVATRLRDQPVRTVFDAVDDYYALRTDLPPRIKQ